MRRWKTKSERLCCFCVLSHSDGAMSWCDDLSLFDDRCTASSCLSSLVAKMMSWCEAIASTAGFADVALSDVADKRVMKKRL